MSDFTTLYLERSEQAQKDLLLILEYLAERTEPSGERMLIDEHVQRAAELCATPFRTLQEREKTEIWTLMNQLSALIAPATVEGLRRAMDPDVSRWSGFRTLIFGVCFLLSATLMVQAYTVLGTRTLDRLNEKNAELNTVYEQINALEEHRPELADGRFPLGLTQFYTEGTKGRATLGSAALKYQHLKYRVDSISSSIETVYKDMYSWNAVWAAPLSRIFGHEPGEYWGFDCRPTEAEPCQSWMATWANGRREMLNGNLIEYTDVSAKLYKSNGTDPETLWRAAPLGHIQIKYGSEVFARSNLEMLRGVWLPVLYGALGACVWLLRERYRQLSLLRWRSPGGGEYLQRVFLGAVLGAALGYLNLSSFLPDTLANISLTGLAFIIGYNVEVIFWLFDHMFSTMRTNQAEAESAK